MLSFGNNGRCKAASRTTTGPILVAGLILVSVIAGCGGKPPARATAEKEAPIPKAASKSKEPSRASDDGAVASKSSSTGGVRKSSRGIPYDAFFDDPLGEANNAAVIAVAKPAVDAGEPAAKPTTDVAKPAAGGGGTAWADFISIDILQDETKKVKNDLASWMKGPGDFNKKCKEIGWDASLLAGLAGIAIEHSEAASWKANAHYIRDFSSELSNAAVEPRKEYYDKSKVAYEKLAAVFGGSIPADAGEVVPKRPFSETADRTGLMKRIHNGNEWLRLNINNEAKLKSEKETILHEAALVAALGKVIATEGYAGTDEEEYQKYAKNLIDGAKEAAGAANDQSFPKFTEAINKIGKSCTECHPKYAT